MAGIADYGTDLNSWGNYPVVEINWQQAVSYCTSQGKRLPTQFEWEVAARGPNAEEKIYPHQNGIDSEFEFNIITQKDHPINALGLQTGRPMTVQSLKTGVSSFGVYQMAGNVAEWTSSWYDPSRFDSLDSDIAVPPADPAAGIKKVYKSGGWDDSLYRSVLYRVYAEPVTFISDQLGFRCVRDVP